MSAEKTVMVVDDARLVTSVIEKELAELGYRVVVAGSAEEALDILQVKIPDLILLDVVMPGMSGFDLCRILRQKPRYNMIPIIMLTAQAQEDDRLRGLELGADDYIAKPFVNRELLARVTNTLTRLDRVRNLNPLSGLRGNQEINHEIVMRIASGNPYAIMYLDLNNFKEYNDVYGFSSGDDLIRMTAGILTGVVEEAGVDSDFVGHIGGDDFVIISDPEPASEMAEMIIRRFEIEKLIHYNLVDRRRGFMIAADRQGITEEYPLVGMAIAILISSKAVISSPRELARAAAGIKKEVKLMNRSAYLIHQE